MKSTKNCSSTKTSNTKSKNAKSTNSASGKKTAKSAKSSQESDSDPLGSYTGNPKGWGKNAVPIQDADDL